MAAINPSTLMNTSCGAFIPIPFQVQELYIYIFRRRPQYKQHFTARGLFAGQMKETIRVMPLNL